LHFIFLGNKGKNAAIEVFAQVWRDRQPEK
jgi:hypothetical protein